MNRIIVDFRPFSLCQNISVYMDGACVESVGIDLDNVSSTVRALCGKYGITKVDMCGNRNYVSKYAAELTNTNFANGTINVEIIERS